MSHFLRTIRDTFEVSLFGDSAASQRCFDYLKGESYQTIVKQIQEHEPDFVPETIPQPVEKAAAKTPEENSPPLAAGPTDPLAPLKSQYLLVIQMVNLLAPNAGGHTQRKSAMFWKYWDKIREDTVRRVLEYENGASVTRDKVFNKLNELEHGRHRE
ncbi:hypothetical protein TRVA0_005S01618 [Trichomonascus vanleenenianus]|uniref:uncharacterized protein n=1 Tax=Trichomonascus vanleenenianus TaxID=2268995 RepID=UPI003ECBA553